MYSEDLDLSFRSTLSGFKCIYSPTARLVHITQHFDPNKDLSTEYYYSRLGILYILKKYFEQEDVNRYISQNIVKLEIGLQKRILNDFNNIKDYDLSVRKSLPNSHIKLFDDFTFSPKRWEI